MNEPKQSKLIQLKNTADTQDLSELLSFEAKKLTYIAYKIHDSDKYISFDINKRSGGVRTIKAPCKGLKLLQSNLAVLLQDCFDEINPNEEKIKSSLSHGFRKKHSIITNANIHIKKRYVFNIDLKDFFGSINFGRVRGFFIKDNRFKLNEKVATIISKIACHDNSLPQGSPCSPIISNLVANILDRRIVKLASKEDCSYSRYADDLTFSTNKKHFPINIAKLIETETNQWQVGNKLTNIIKKSGFVINETKTRMQYKTSSQVVTGLVVNKKANTNAKYRHQVRAMVNNLSKTLSFQMTHFDSDGNKEKKNGSLEELKGMLSFIDSVESFNEQKQKNNKLNKVSSARESYKQFLFLENFFLQKNPVLMCEGKTDGIYIKCALQSLAKSYPSLIEKEKETYKLKIKIFKYSKTIGRVLKINGGGNQVKNLIVEYMKVYKIIENKEELKKIKPLIILLDNDEGANPVFSYIKDNKDKLQIEFNNKNELKHKSFIKINPHLYVITTPLLVNDRDSSIEDFFNQNTRNKIYNGRNFCKENECDKKCIDHEKHYGKKDFADNVILPNKDNICFDGFEEILNRIVEVLKDQEEATL